MNVFFVLSGFLITTLALREEVRRGRLSLKSFYIRRFFRIYPTYFAVLALYCVLIYVFGFVAERRELFDQQLPYYVFGFPEYQYFDIQGGIESGPPFAGAWSIGIEEKFYLVWPLLGFVFLRGAFRGRIVACVVAAFLCTLALVGIVLSSGRETPWLRSPSMVLIGKVSFVFYLTHNFALNIVEKTPLGRDGLLWSIGDVLLAFPLGVLFAWVIHVSFERPLVRVGHKLAKRDKPFHGV